MKRVCLSLFTFLVLLSGAAAVGLVTETQAQTRDKYVISATAGGINYITGDVTATRKGTLSREALTDKDNLESGDVVRTGAYGRVEVLLNPGSYLRVAENSEFEFTNTALDRLSIRLTRGSAVVEAVGTDDTEVSLEINTAQTRALLVKRGVYRINILPTGETEVLVRKGRALVGATSEVVKSGQKIVVGHGRMEMAKIDKKLQDALDLWSRDRADYLASLNRGLRDNRTLEASLSEYSTEIWLSANRRGLRHGYWVYANGCYVFVPVYGGGWSSPYGHDYGGYRTGCCNNRPRNNPPNPTQPGPTRGGIPEAGPVNPPPAPDAPPADLPDRPRRSERPRGSNRPGRPMGDSGPREVDPPRRREGDNSGSSSGSVSRTEPQAPRESPPPSPPPPSAPPPSPPPSPPPQPAYTPPPSPPPAIERPVVEAPRGRNNPND